VFQQSSPGGPITSQVLDQFAPGASFDAALALYAFDKQLRLLVLEAIEQIEIAARVDIAHYLGAVDTFAHVNPALLDGNFTTPGAGGAQSLHDAWMGKLADCTSRSREEFVDHYRTKYGQPLPIWVAIEVWDFGLVSKFTNGMRFTDKLAMATRFGVPNAPVFASWLRSINYLRNLAAHHSRVWNRNIVDQPKMPKVGQVPQFDPVIPTCQVKRVYPLLCILAYLMCRTRQDTDWHTRLAAHLIAFPATGVGGVDLSDMGCPADWQTHAFWR
jgi:abortive infection bacteriophage resistance protein